MTSLLWLIGFAIAADPVQTQTLPIRVSAPASPDRSAPPAVRPAIPRPHPEPTTVTLAPGVELVHVRAPGVRHVRVNLWFHQGTWELRGEPDPAAAAMGDLWTEASAEWSGKRLAEALDLHQLDVGSHVGDHDAQLGLEAPVEFLEIGMDILASLATNPLFPPAEVRRWRRDTARALEFDAPSSPGALAAWTLGHGWYPADHPYGARPDLGAIRRVRRGAIRRRHRQLLSHAPVTITVVGDVPASVVRSHLLEWVDRIGRDAPKGEELEVPTPQSQVLAVDVPELDQSYIRLRTQAPSRADADRMAFAAADFAIGGTFMSRLNHNLREENGYTYGASSAYAAFDRRGHWTVSVEVAAQNTGPAIEEIGREIDRFIRIGATQDELTASHRERVALWNDTFRTAASTEGFYHARMRGRERVKDALGRIRAAEDLTPDEVTEAASRWIDSDKPRLWVIVADRRTVEPQLEALGMSAKWLTPEQSILGLDDTSSPTGSAPDPSPWSPHE